MSNYILIGLDMRNTKLLQAILRSIPGFSDTDPTFLLSEVVLTYMAVNRYLCRLVLKRKPSLKIIKAKFLDI